MLLLVLSCTSLTDNAISTNDMVITEITGYTKDDTMTKTGIEDNGSGGKDVVWKSGNAISLFFNTGNSGGSQFTTTNSGTIATFTGSISAISGDLSGTGGSAYFWAVYPYNSNASCNGTSITTELPNTQAAYPNDIADDLLITIGRSPNLSIYFRNTCSVIEFKLSKEYITKISFSGNNNELIAGRFYASFDDNNAVMVNNYASGKKTITVSPAESSYFATGTKYYLVLLPQHFSNGYSITFTRSDGYTATYTSSADITLSAGYFYTMYNKDSGLTFKDSSSNAVPIPTAVDLGLSVKWASFNLGASTESECGGYYSWGMSYNAGSTWTNYKFVSGYLNNEPQFTKYNTVSTYGPIDNKTVLDAEDDVAHVKLGGKWRMPTCAEFQELIDNCTWTFATVDDVYGFYIKSKTNSNKIFLPRYGHKEGSTVHSNTHGYYWSSSLRTEDSRYAMFLLYYTGSGSMYKNIDNGAQRNYALPIRPVKEY